MYDDTPNKEHLDPFIERIHGRYQFEKLKDWPLDRLEGEEWLLENEFMRFKASFPPEGSGISGELRAFVFDNPNETKKAITSAESVRLEQVKKEAKSEIYRAIGHRKLKRREQRNELVNSGVDFVEAINRGLLAVWSTVREITPW